MIGTIKEMGMSRNRSIIVIGGVVAVVLILVVVGNVATAHTNPPVNNTIQWDSPETEKLFRTACMDCHSNETTWPWYSYVAPVSFLIAHDVEEGRDAMNLSTDRRVEGREMIEQIENGKMPKSPYPMLHPEANLSADQKAQLIAGIRATFGAGGGRGGEAGESGESGQSGEGSESGG
jgi:mono/diheme cytochrome c family protein